MAEDSLIEPDEEPIRLDADEKPLKLEGDNEPIRLVEPEGSEDLGEGGLKTFGVAAEAEEKTEYKRSLNVNGAGATRYRLFHSKIALSPLENMQRQINEWLDSDEIEVKQVGHLIGTMEGKRPEPNLLVMIWY